MSIKLVTDKCIIRPFRVEDINSIAFHADDKDVAAYMRDDFPYPYKIEDAMQFFNDISAAEATVKAFAIDIDGEAVGSIGYLLKDDVYKRNAELGYWLGRKYWGKGITTAALIALTDYIWKNENFIRLYLEIFSPNKASMKVAEGAGYKQEAVFKKSILKNNVLMDNHIYSSIKPQR